VTEDFDSSRLMLHLPGSTPPFLPLPRGGSVCQSLNHLGVKTFFHEKSMLNPEEPIFLGLSQETRNFRDFLLKS